MKLLATVMFLSIGAVSTVVQNAEKPLPVSRTVSGQVLTSQELPAVNITFEKPFKYVGGQSFILYGVANAEQHFFVDADKEGRIKRFYWIQFEGYLPSNTHSYRYQVKRSVNIGGLDFIADAYPRKIDANSVRPDSDSAHARKFLMSKGLTMADDVLLQRLVHLIDEAKRNELMIIYMEDLDPLALTAADLSPQGKAADRWDKISQGLLDRSTKGLKISQLKK